MILNNDCIFFAKQILVSTVQPNDIIELFQQDSFAYLMSGLIFSICGKRVGTN